MTDHEILKLLCQIAVSDGIPISMGKKVYDQLRAFADSPAEKTSIPPCPVCKGPGVYVYKGRAACNNPLCSQAGYDMFPAEQAPKREASDGIH